MRLERLLPFQAEPPRSSYLKLNRSTHGLRVLRGNFSHAHLEFLSDSYGATQSKMEQEKHENRTTGSVADATPSSLVGIAVSRDGLARWEFGHDRDSSSARRTVLSSASSSTLATRSAGSAPSGINWWIALGKAFAQAMRDKA